MHLVKTEQNPSSKTAISTSNNWIWPGMLITIAAAVRITVHYNQQDGNYQTELKLFVGDTRVENYNFDQNNQIDLRHLCGIMLTRQATRINPNTKRPIKTLIEYANVPYSWNRETACVKH